MPDAPVATFLVLLTLASVLAVSGMAKLREPVAVEDAFVSLRVPGFVPRRPAARALPWVELALAALLLLSPAPLLIAVAAVALALMVTYTGLVARAIGFDEPVTCSCFGSLGRHEVDRTTLARNLLLTVLAVGAVWLALADASGPEAVADLDEAGWWAVAAATVSATVAVLVAGRGRPTPADTAAEQLDYERQATPFGALTLTGGRTVTLAELTSTQARLLVVLNPGCRPCTRTAERLDPLAARLAPAVGVIAVYPDETATLVTEHSRDLAAWEPDLNIRRVFSVGTPAAILLGADGFLAGGPVAGEKDVAAFFDDVAEALAEQPPPAE